MLVQFKLKKIDFYNDLKVPIEVFEGGLDEVFQKLFTYLFIHSFIYLFIYLFTHLFIYLFFRNEFLIFLHQQLKQAVDATETRTNALRLQFLKKL